MAGRGDNNKNGTSGNGASHQSMQGMQNGAREKAAHGKQTGGSRSQEQDKTRSQSANRDSSLEGDKR